MALKLYNTATGTVDEFKSINDKKVFIYSCGPTVYGNPHIGNWSGYIYWDLLVRLLQYKDYDVKRVINITDVGHLTSDGDTGEDKLEKCAKKEHKTAWEVAKEYTEIFNDGFAKLNLVAPNFMPNASDFIPQQLELIKSLKLKGATYQIDDGIYFDTSKFPKYADFAHLDLANQMAGARVNINTQKHNPSDFAVWKFSPKNESRDMEWATPKEIMDTPSEDIVMGFPGWHIECSAIALSLLGNTIDIHTGGIDAIPVHHTNEIAQSEMATGKTFSNFWLHCNFIKVDGKKMSKSLGNTYTLSDIIEKGYSPMDFRMLILQGNYRNEGNFTFDNLIATKNHLANWKNVAALRHQIHDTIISHNDKNKSDHSVSLYALTGAIIESLENNLNTPETLKLIDEAFSRIQKVSPENINKQSLVDALESIDELLGLNLLGTTPDINDKQKALIIERNNARSQKDWSKSDKLRNKLKNDGIIIRDIDHENSIWEYNT